MDRTPEITEQADGGLTVRWADDGSAQVTQLLPAQPRHYLIGPGIGPDEARNYVAVWLIVWGRGES